MRIAVATPRRPGAVSGNDVTALRWKRRLSELGHDAAVVTVDPAAAATTRWDDDESMATADVLVALHARRSASVVCWWTATFGDDRPLVVGLAGTDLYSDLPGDAAARVSVEVATSLAVLQPKALERLASVDPAAVAKAHVVYQSVDDPPRRDTDRRAFRVAVLAHLREVKDPLLAARAARMLPSRSTVRVDHAGVAHDESWRRAALDEMAANPRYEWYGELSRPDALAVLGRASVLACTSRLEGGANVVTEALAAGVPVVGTRIDGNAGLLGDSYPGLVPVGDVAALAGLLDRLERDPDARAELQVRIDERRHLAHPDTERRAWADLLASIG